LLTVLDEDALTVITDDLDHRPEVPLLLQLTAEPAERLGEERFTSGSARRGRRGARSTTCSRATSARSRTRSTT
jgi:hypothetical protein